MDPHSHQHEEFLAKVVTEDDPRAVLKRSNHSDCPDCEDRLEELLAVASRLEGAGTLAREDIASGRDPLPAVGEHAVESVLGRELRAAAARRRASLLRRAAAGFAAVAAVFLFVFWLGSTPPPQTTTLGPDASWNVEPTGAVAEWGTLRWSGVSGAWYDVRVFDARNDEAPALTERTHLYGSAWTPSPEEAAGWPSRIRWEVRAFDDDGELTGEHEAEAWLERP